MVKACTVPRPSTYLIDSSRSSRDLRSPSPKTFMPPGPERPGSWTYSDNVFWHLVETASVLEGAAPELALYRMEFYYVGPVQLRRYTLRLDGFASIQAPTSGGELVTPPLTFNGRAEFTTPPVERPNSAS